MNLQISPLETTAFPMKVKLVVKSMNEHFIRNPEVFLKINSVINKSVTQTGSKVQPGRKVSLRKIEWFITHFAAGEDNGMLKSSKAQDDEILCDIYEDYERLLRSYKKKMFDPFCRKYKVKITWVDENDGHNEFVTSCGQLKFFQWFIESGYLDLFERNIDRVSESIPRDKEEKKRQQTSTKSASSKRTIKKHSLSHCVKLR